MIEFPRGARLVRKTQRTETIFEGDTTKSSHFLNPRGCGQVASGWLSNVKRLEAGVTPLTFRFMCLVDGSSPERLGHVDPARVSAREELFSLVLKNSLVDLKVCKLFPGIFTDFHSKLFRD